ESFKTARFKIPRGKRYRRFFRLPSGTMKERERRGVVFICERHFRERECRRPGKFAVAVIVEHFLQVGASIRVAMQVSIAFTERKVRVRPARPPRIVLEIL